jgi:nucleotide-binding universal stress UspA family protein
METAKSTAESSDRPIAEAPSSVVPLETGRPLRILVGYDGLSGSRDALAFATALCEKTEVELTVASGHDHDPIGLKELAEAEDSDMIVIGSGSRGRIGCTSLGRVAEGVLDGASCAVAVVPRGLADTDVSIRTIAVGYDGSKAAAAALHQAVRLAARVDASLTILGAVEISLGLAGFETRQPKDFQRAQMERHLRRALGSVPPDISAESRLLLGEPGETIIAAANGVDLLILGSQGNYSAVSRLVLGSVGAAVMRNAPCPTLITPIDS